MSEVNEERRVDLEVSEELVCSNPSVERLRATLEAQADEDSFFVLSRSPMTYMQGVMHDDGGYQLEYQVDDLEHHYRAERALTLDEAVEITAAYVRGDDSWLQACPWERMEL